jgi:signal transduction histidine kinase
MQRREIDLNDVLRDILRLVRFESSRKGIALEESFAEIPTILADANRLKQVFVNLAMNALQAMSASGTLSVSTEAGSDGHSVRVIFADDGPGIPRELQEKIFEPFFTTKADGEGTGLGLYICRNIVLEHEGKMTLDSSPGRGTRFVLEFPVA